MKPVLTLPLFCFFLVITIYAQPPIQWQTSMGGSYEDDAYDIQTTSDGGYIMIGITESYNGDVSGNHGGFDAWVIKLGSVTGTEESQGDTNWQVFPNPTTGILEIQSDDNTPFVVVSMLDLFGRKLIEQKMSSNQSINLSNLPNGVYIVSARSATGKIYQKKIVKK